MYRGLTRAGGVVLFALLSACGGTAVDRPEVATAPPKAEQPFIGKTWMSTDASAPHGMMRIFLPDGTLIMDSCFETYRLVRWHAIDDRRIEWQEDTARIEAEVTQPTSEQLQLRLRLVSEIKEENYRLFQEPFVCPDARPTPPAP